MYTNRSIEDVNAADIVTTISRYFELKKQGANYVAKSPFTTEKTASFVVSPSKQMFKDFSSGKGGNGVKFVMEMDKCEWIEAVVKVASIHNITLEKEQMPEEQARVVKEKTSLLSITTRAAARYVANFKELPETHWAIEMIAKRGFSQETIIDFQIGFALNENQITTAVSSIGRLAQSIELGLTSQGSGNSYDFFRNRIMFPIHNTQGVVVGFGGRRSNAPEDEKYAKYLNSKESKLYDKQSVLYGLNQAKTEIRKLGYVILTEGYTDVIGMHDKGACNTVATCGTALTETHCKELRKYCEHVLLLRDGDPAGIKASVRDINILLPFGFQVSIFPLSDGIDPDDLARTHGEDVQDYIFQNRIDGLVWLAERTAEEFVSSNYKLNVEKTNKDLEINLQTVEANRILLDAIEEETDRKKAIAHNNKLDKEAEAFRKEAEKAIKDFPMIDPYSKQRGMTELYQTLSLVKNEITLKETLRNIAKIVDVPIKDMDKEIANVILQRKEKEKKAKDNNKQMKPHGFPVGADLEQYFKDRFAIVGNEYYFEKSDNFFVGTNFHIQPLYHIKGRKDNKRLCELVNIDNQKFIIDFDSESLVSYADFRKELIRAGNLRFLSGTNTFHFDLVVSKISNNFNTALELQTLGWNEKGFFAFANGVYWQKEFINVNNYGICYLQGVANKDEEDGYSEKVEYYYSPAFSVMHKRNQAGDDPYENDRKFVYKKADITLDQWMRQMMTVFQEKGMIGIIFNFASLFRDVFLKNYDYFPLLGGFGEKDSGKSGFGKIIQNFFFYQDEPLELNQATLVGLNRRLSRTTNTVTFLDEYQNNLDEKILQALKGAWNGLGREKGQATADKRTVVDKINQAVYYAGQYLPTSDDNALQTRTICLQFPSKNYTPQEKEEFNKLISWTNAGLSSLLLELVDHREYFIAELHKNYVEVIRELKDRLGKMEYQERIFSNFAVLLIAYRILESKINFPFTYQKFFNYCVTLLLENSDNVADSNGLSEFWNIIQFLVENNIILEESHFIIDQLVSFKIVGQNDKTEDYFNTDRNKILYLRLNTVHQFYQREASRRNGVQIIGETTLRNYFKSRPYYIGRTNAKDFKGNKYSAFIFNYTMMQKMGIATLDKIQEGETIPIDFTEERKDDLPF